MPIQHLKLTNSQDAQNFSVLYVMLLAGMNNCQAKVQVQVQRLKSKDLRTWTLAYTKIIQPPTTHHATFQTLPEVLQSSVIPFQKPLMTLY